MSRHETDQQRRIREWNERFERFERAKEFHAAAKAEEERLFEASRRRHRARLANEALIESCLLAERERAIYGVSTAELRLAFERPKPRADASRRVSSTPPWAVLVEYRDGGYKWHTGARSEAEARKLADSLRASERDARAVQARQMGGKRIR